MPRLGVTKTQHEDTRYTWFKQPLEPLQQFNRKSVYLFTTKNKKINHNLNNLTIPRGAHKITSTFTNNKPKNERLSEQGWRGSLSGEPGIPSSPQWRQQALFMGPFPPLKPITGVLVIPSVQPEAGAAHLIRATWMTHAHTLTLTEGAGEPLQHHETKKNTIQYTKYDQGRNTPFPKN